MFVNPNSRFTIDDAKVTNVAWRATAQRHIDLRALSVTLVSQGREG